MEELAQILNISTARERAKYSSANFETIAVFVAALSGVDKVADVIDRIVLNILIGNGDAHLKNWAFTYPDGKLPLLSPVYDVLPTTLYIPDDDLGLNLRRSKRFETVAPQSFDILGVRTGFGSSEARIRAISAVERILDHWTLLKNYFSTDKYDQLTRRLDSLQLVKERI